MAREELELRRSELLLRGARAPTPPAELSDELAELETALRGLDLRDAPHAEELMLEYERTLEASCGLRAQSGLRWRAALRGAVVLLGLFVTLVAVHHALPLASYDRMAAICEQSASATGQRHVDVRFDIVEGVALRCIARADRDCADACQSHGLCAVRDGVCKATQRDHCAASAACRDEGACANIGWACEPANDVHCANSTACANAGRCSFDHDFDQCVPGSFRDPPGLRRNCCGEVVGEEDEPLELVACRRVEACVEANLCAPGELTDRCRTVLEAQHFCLCTLAGSRYGAGGQ